MTETVAAYIRKHPKASSHEIARACHLTLDGVRYYIAKLITSGAIRRENGKWIEMKK